MGDVKTGVCGGLIIGGQQVCRWSRVAPEVARSRAEKHGRKKKRPALRLHKKQRAPLRKVRERAGRRQAACGQAACSRANSPQRGLFSVRLLRWSWAKQVRGSDRAARGASKQVSVGSWLVPTAEVRPKSRPPETTGPVPERMSAPREGVERCVLKSVVVRGRVASRLHLQDRDN